MDPSELVPIDEARRLAHDYNKDRVIILTWSVTQLQVVTFGKDAWEKEWAARAGTRLFEFFGVEVAGLLSHEDFRTKPAHQAALEIDVLKQRIRDLEHQLRKDPQREGEDPEHPVHPAAP